MEPIQLRLDPKGQAKLRYRLSLAGEMILSDDPLKSVLPPEQVREIPALGLEAQAADPFEASLENGLSSAPEGRGPSPVRGLVAGQSRETLVTGDSPPLLVRISSLGSFLVSRDEIRRLDGALEASQDELEQAVLGPLLLLPLALRDTFCLHCSAAVGPGGLTVFLGESGDGKSTLGRALGERDWERFADDVLPVRLTAEGLLAWSDYPQLKDPLSPASPTLRVERIFLLGRQETLSLDRLSPAEAALALTAHTAASRLFPKALLARHFELMSEAAGRCGVHRLAYPRRWEVFDEVLEALADT